MILKRGNSDVSKITVCNRLTATEPVFSEVHSMYSKMLQTRRNDGSCSSEHVSDGNAQIMDVAQRLFNPPQVLFLDEPRGGSVVDKNRLAMYDFVIVDHPLS